MQELWTTISSTFINYMHCYYDMLMKEWQYLTPMKYSIVLASILVFGWVLMKNGSKRVG